MAREECSRRDQRWYLKGMTALVTGGTRGIGSAIVEELARFGATIHTCSRNQNELNEKLLEWKGKGYTINNAASTLLKPAIEHTAENFSNIMRINLESPFHVSQLAYPLLKSAPAGTAGIVFVSSIAGVVALPTVSVYAASKGAINQLTKNLACEWAKDKIRINTVAPWAVKTTIHSEEAVHEYIPKMFEELMDRTPLCPIAEPDEISSIVTFLCLPAASLFNKLVI